MTLFLLLLAAAGLAVSYGSLVVDGGPYGRTGLRVVGMLAGAFTASISLIMILMG